MTGSGPGGGVCVVGSINVDTTYRVPRIPAPGETVLAQSRSRSPGGKGANQAAAAASLGGAVTIVGCTGDDADGRWAIDSLIHRGVDVAWVRTTHDARTGTAAVAVSPDGENAIVVDPGANQLLDPGLVKDVVSAGAHGVVLVQLEVNLDAVLSAAMSSGPATLVLNPAPMTAHARSLALSLIHI